MRLLALAAVVVLAPLPNWHLTVGAKGQRVRDAQWAMATHNVFRMRTYSGPFDGRYDGAVALATQRTKYRLGYPQSDVNRSYGSVLRAYLLGARKLPAAYVKRRNARRPAPFLYSYPVKATNVRYIGFPGQGTHSYYASPNNWESDRAVDLDVRAGTPVLAVSRGYVCRYCGFGSSGSSASRFGGARLTLYAVGPSGAVWDEFYYAHLRAYAIGVYPGAWVKAGQLLGWSGTANGVPHLHFAERYGSILSFLASTKTHVRTVTASWPLFAMAALLFFLLGGGITFHTYRIRKLKAELHHLYHDVVNTPDDSGLDEIQPGPGDDKGPFQL